jgi:hypothetical protein
MKAAKKQSQNKANLFVRRSACSVQRKDEEKEF